MTVTEKVAYIKGLADGLGIDQETKEGKILTAIIDVLEDISFELEDIQDNAYDLAEEIDALSEDLEDVEDIVFGDDEDDCDCCCGCDDDDDCDCCCDDDEEEEFMYSVVCPACNEELEIEESVLELDSIQCPACGETLEFEFDEDDEEDED